MYFSLPVDIASRRKMKVQGQILPVIHKPTQLYVVTRWILIRQDAFHWDGIVLLPIKNGSIASYKAVESAADWPDPQINFRILNSIVTNPVLYAGKQYLLHSLDDSLLQPYYEIIC